jgi:hypothetical protein
MCFQNMRKSSRCQRSSVVFLDSEHAEQKGSRRWFDPTQKTFLERVKAEANSLLVGDDQAKRQLNLSFINARTDVPSSQYKGKILLKISISTCAPGTFLPVPTL